MLPRLTRDWEGETVFVIAGGPSVAGVDLSRLHGHRVVVVNSSYITYPNADALVFTDLRWWKKHEHRVRETFRGEIVTVTPSDKRYHGLTVLQRQRSSGISTDPTRLACWHTSMTTAFNYTYLRGAARTAVLGLDGDGDWHHEPHPIKWGINKNKFAFHATALHALVEPLHAAGHEVLNLNLDSKHGMFPFATLDEVLAHKELVAA